MKYNYYNAQSGGPKFLFDEEMADISATGGTAIFKNAPKGTSHIELNVEGASLRLRYGKLIPTTSVGHLYGVGTEPYEFDLCYEEAINVRAIGASTGHISYFGTGI